MSEANENAVVREITFRLKQKKAKALFFSKQLDIQTLMLKGLDEHAEIEGHVVLAGAPLQVKFMIRKALRDLEVEQVQI